jgi:hypothetical protein
VNLPTLIQMDRGQKSQIPEVKRQRSEREIPEIRGQKSAIEA